MFGLILSSGTFIGGRWYDKIGEKHYMHSRVGKSFNDSILDCENDQAELAQLRDEHDMEFHGRYHSRTEDWIGKIFVIYMEAKSLDRKKVPYFVVIV